MMKLEDGDTPRLVRLREHRRGSGRQVPAHLQREPIQHPASHDAREVRHPRARRRHSYLTFDSLELTAEKQGWVQFSSLVKARVGAISTEEVALTAGELEFTSKNIVLKTAANTPGLAAAPAVDALSLKLNLDRPSESFFPLGETTTQSLIVVRREG